VPVGVDLYNGLETGDRSMALCRNNAPDMVPAIAFNARQDPISGDVPGTGALDQDPLTQCVAIQEVGKRTGKSTDDPRAGVGIAQPGDPMFTLQAGAQHGVAQPVCFSCKDHGADAGEVAPTLRGLNHDKSHANGGGQVAVAFDLRGREGGAMPEGMHDTANVRAASGGSSRSYVAGMQVRRLTPIECERLQGFPDGYTLVPYRGKLMADGPRYKMIGNSWAVPVVRWIGRRIDAELRKGVVKVA
jgi:DNA (cytosine-5)-methyltransferase 1